jgi:predicted metallopeptidase
MKWFPAPDINHRISHLITHLDLTHADAARIFCFRSQGSVGRTTARIWSLPSIWQLALNEKPGYCLEVISEKFDRLSLDNQERVLIHELMHIPRTFSGSLSPHRNSSRRIFRRYHDEVENLYRSLKIKSFEALHS